MVYVIHGTKINQYAYVVYSLKHTTGHQYIDSFVECEGLNQLGRFSFNKFNREVEVSY